jgi:hypothetical protein
MIEATSIASGALIGAGIGAPVFAALNYSFMISSLRISGGMLAIKSGSNPMAIAWATSGSISS